MEVVNTIFQPFFDLFSLTIKSFVEEIDPCEPVDLRKRFTDLLGFADSLANQVDEVNVGLDLRLDFGNFCGFCE